MNLIAILGQWSLLQSIPLFGYPPHITELTGPQKKIVWYLMWLFGMLNTNSWSPKFWHNIKKTISNQKHFYKKNKFMMFVITLDERHKACFSAENVYKIRYGWLSFVFKLLIYLYLVIFFGKCVSFNYEIKGWSKLILTTDSAFTKKLILEQSFFYGSVLFHKGDQNLLQCPP